MRAQNNEKRKEYNNKESKCMMASEKKWKECINIIN
jgi:hypothetical protein